MKNFKIYYGIVAIVLLSCLSFKVQCEQSLDVNKAFVTFSPSEVTLELNTIKKITIYFNETRVNETYVTFNYGLGDSAQAVQDHEIIEPIQNITLGPNITEVSFELKSVNIGSLVVGLNSSSNEFFNLNRAVLRVSVVHSSKLLIIEQIIGWIYFLAWSISFYPQIFHNFRRKSVLGLSFDFVSLNVTGFIAYSVFNLALFFIPSIQAEYFKLHPRGVNPVEANDVAFAVHAVALTIVTLIQCCIYERGSQKVSVVGLTLITLVWLTFVVLLLITIFHVITWLTFVYCFSYIKLFITLVKYFPQAWINFRRKSTEGWSIGNVLLDFTGGMFSLLQMFLIAYNSDDWGSLFGDPTKFGLGAFSILFDVIFMLQHYVLYRKQTPYENIVDVA